MPSLKRPEINLMFDLKPGKLYRITKSQHMYQREQESRHQPGGTVRFSHGRRTWRMPEKIKTGEVVMYVGGEFIKDVRDASRFWHQFIMPNGDVLGMHTGFKQITVLSPEEDTTWDRGRSWCKVA